jgi:hypothetical protein
MFKLSFIIVMTLFIALVMFVQASIHGEKLFMRMP